MEEGPIVCLLSVQCRVNPATAQRVLSYVFKTSAMQYWKNYRGGFNKPVGNWELRKTHLGFEFKNF